MNAVLYTILALAFVPLFISLTTWRSRKGQGGAPAHAELAVCLLIAGAVALSIYRSSRPTWWPSIQGKWVISCNIRGAELWVNGVNLGPTPVITTEKEFLAKVPPWQTPPSDFKQEFPLLRPQPFANISPWRCPRWYDLSQLQKFLEPGRYFAQFKLAGEIGLFPPNSSYDGSVSNGDTFNSYLSVAFPGREARLRSLLNQARLADYHVTPAWFAAIESYNADGYLALRRAILYEPAMREVFNDWARWKYHIPANPSPAEAWAAFQRVCRDADSQQEYFTPSLAGHAVELLADHLDPAQVEAAAEHLLGTLDSYMVSSWDVAGQHQFGVTYRPGGTDLGGDSDDFGFNQTSSGGGNRWAPPRAYAIAHALVQLWQNHRGHDVIQRRLAPRLLAYFSGHQSPECLPLLELASQIGGPQVDHFLLHQTLSPALIPSSSQDWWTQSAYLSGINTGDQKINRSFYLVSLLNDHVGEAFRATHAADVVSIDERITSNLSGFLPIETLDFLTAHHDLASRFYPRFALMVGDKNPDDALTWQWQYLDRIHADPVLFVQAFANTHPTTFCYSGIGSVFNAMDENRRILIARAVLHHIAATPDLQKLLADPHADHHWILDYLHTAALPLTDQILLPLIATVAGTDRMYPPNYLFKKTGWWLSVDEGANSAVVPLLAARPEPALRTLALTAIRAAPTPRNRALLHQLLADPDPSVRKQATTLATDLAALAAEAPLDYSTSLPFAPSSSGLVVGGVGPE